MNSINSALTPAALAAAADAHIPAEQAIFAAARPNSQARHQVQAGGFVDNVPLIWMLDWPTPFPVVLEGASGCQLTDIDGHRILDLCLGDTGAMFGHGPAPIVAAMQGAARRGMTHMLPSADAAEVGPLLVKRFGLPRWQVATTASDANRFSIRVARAVTGRKKIIVFDGCYHGAVDDTLVDLVDGKTTARHSLLGQVYDTGLYTVSIPFNDEAALRDALKDRDVACVLAEPVMTNCGMILPVDGFHDILRQATREAGTLLLLDETHTVSTGLGGYTGVHGLDPDIFVLGKPVGGGIPVSVWGMTQAVADRYDELRTARANIGHSGIGTTLSGSALQLACLRACLEEVMTAEAYTAMMASTDIIAAGLTAAIEKRGLPWHVARVGARIEVVFSPTPVRDAGEARAVACRAIEIALHLSLLNRGYLLTPFHNMVLIGPAVTTDEAEQFVVAYGEVLDALLARVPL
jgi:glutamate-1-semialdehyde 2,1-aminomutase